MALLAVIFQALFFVAVCFAQEIPDLQKPARYGSHLKEILEDAAQSNPRILAARQNISAAQSLKMQAWGIPDPALNWENDTAPRNIADPHGGDKVHYGISQALPFPVKLFRRARLASQEVELAQAQCDEVVIDVSSEIKKAYSDLTLAQRSLELLEEAWRAMEEFRKIAGAKYSLGKTSQADVLGAQMGLGQILNEKSIQEAEEISAQAALKALLNRPEIPDIRVPMEQDVQPLEASVEELLMRTQDVNPSLRAMKAEVEKGQTQLSRARLEYAPEIFLKAEYLNREHISSAWDGAVGVTVPLWAWKQEGGIAQARAELEKKKNLLQGEKNKVMAQASQAYARARSAWQISQNLKTLMIPQAEQTLQVSRASYESDKLDFVSLLNYWKVLLDYRLSLLKAMAQYEQALADLEKAVGMAIELGMAVDTEKKNK